MCWGTRFPSGFSVFCISIAIGLSLTITCLAACTLTAQAAFGDEAVEEVAEAVEREGAAKGIREVAARDGVLTGKEVGKGGIKALLIDVGPHGQRVLIDFEATQGIQQPLIRREADAIDMDVAASPSSPCLSSASSPCGSLCAE